MSRLLFTRPENSEPVLRRKVAEISKITDEPEISDIFDRMNEECIRQTQYGLSYMVNAYKNATDAYSDNELWENQRTAAKRIICLKLFIQNYSPDTPVIKDLLDSIKGKNSDYKVPARLTGTNKDGTEKVDVCFLLLLAWGIINPFRFRTRNEKSPQESMKPMLCLLDELDKYLEGKMGVFEKIPVISDIHREIMDNLENHQMLTTAQLWSYLDVIGETLRMYEIENLDQIVNETSVLHLPGIWIDDADKGENRFWIFPVNLKMAFQYRRSDNGWWRLVPYEFILYKPNPDEPETWYTAMITSKANEAIVLGEPVSADEMAVCDFELEYASNDMIEKVSFIPIEEPVPEWHDWRSFIRVTESDDRFVEYIGELKSFYPENSMCEGCLDIDRHQWMIDIQWALVAIDEDYLYISDFKTPPYYRMRKADKNEDKEYSDVDDYVYKPSASSVKRNLIDLEISVEQPLYRIPRKPKSKISYPDAKGKEKLLREKEDFKIFCDIVRNTNFGDQITIYQHKRKVICFNKFGKIYELSKIVQEYGVKKFTSREDLFNIHNTSE